MAYVAVTGGREAIEQSLKLLEIFRESGEDITISCIMENMGLLIDKIMSEAGFYSREYAVLALKQCEGSVEEAVFLLRAYRSTLPRNYYSNVVDTSGMRLIRRISAAFKDIPGGQILGPTYDYSHRLLDFSLMDGEKKKETAEMDAGAEEQTKDAESSLPENALEELGEEESAREESGEEESGEDIRCGRVTDLLKEEGVMAEVEEDNTEPFDVTSNLLTFPAPRSARLQTFARSDAGFLGGVAYSSMRGYGAVHPTVSELRCGYLEICVPYVLDEEDEICIGEILVIEELPISLECRVEEINQYDKTLRIVSEIVNVSVDEEILDGYGKIDLEKLNAISYDPANHTYLKVGEKVGTAFSDGKKLN